MIVRTQAKNRNFPGKKTPRRGRYRLRITARWRFVLARARSVAVVVAVEAMAPVGRPKAQEQHLPYHVEHGAGIGTLPGRSARAHQRSQRGMPARKLTRQEVGQRSSQ
jgi:hypothetical protein